MSGKNYCISHEKSRCIQVSRELNAENQDREINGLLEAMDFFDREEGEILTFDTEDIVLTKGKKITVIPAWKWLFIA